jgi:hypothetical protein
VSNRVEPDHRHLEQKGLNTCVVRCGFKIYAGIMLTIHTAVAAAVCHQCRGGAAPYYTTKACTNGLSIRNQ